MKRTQRSFNSTLRPMRPKTEDRVGEWAKVKVARVVYLIEKYGCPICEWCGGSGNLVPDNPFWLTAHHIDGDRKNNTQENCYICHSKCHPPKHIKVEQEDFQGRI